MKTKAISSIFLLFYYSSRYDFNVTTAFADHHEITITPIAGSGFPDSGCEVDGCYTPSTVTIGVGSVVIFSNTDNVAHTFPQGFSIR